VTLSLERRDGRPLRIGHRGAQALAPENTLRSFRAAVDVGVDLIEFDVLALRDGVLVLAHSNDLFEVSHGAAHGKVRDLPLDRLREAAPDLPTLDEALAYFADEAPDIGVHLDLKTGSAARAVQAALERHGLVDRTLVSSFDFGALRALARNGSGVRTGLTLPRAALGIKEEGRLAPVAGAGLRVLRRTLPSLVGRLLSLSRATALVLHHTAVSPSAVARAHARGAAVVTWTVDDIGELRRVEEAGVDAVVTNDPRIFVSTLTT
jgi:glycerophosphoryl diester phosphodiesterase